MVAARRRPDPVIVRRPVDVRGRPPRRFPRLLFAALAATLLVVAVNSIITTSSRGPDVAVAYADRIRPAVDRSTRQAAAVDDLRGQAGQLPATGLRRALTRLTRESAALVREVRQVDPPDDLTVAHGLLITTLATRDAALDRFAAAITAEQSAPLEASVNSLELAGKDLVVSDRSYQLFLDRLPRPARRTMPPSVWVTDPARWERPEMAALLATVRASASSAPIHDVTIVTITPTPSPVGVAEGDRQVLPRARSLRLDVVVANAGNEPAKRVAVEAVLTMTGGMDTARQFVDLQPGQRQTVGLVVTPPAGEDASVRVRVGPVGGEDKTGDNEQTINYVIK